MRVFGAPTPSWLRDLRRAVRWHRRLLAGLLLGGSMAVALGTLAPPPAPHVLVLAAARDLAGGQPLSGGDLRTEALPPAAVPAGALRPGDLVAGRTVASPLRRGEVVTDVRLVGPALLGPLAAAGLVAVPVRVADAASVRLVHAGDRIGVIAASPTSGRTTAVGAALQVLSVPASAADGGEGALVLVAAPPDTATRLAAAAVTARLSLTISGR